MVAKADEFPCHILPLPPPPPRSISLASLTQPKAQADPFLPVDLLSLRWEALGCSPRDQPVLRARLAFPALSPGVLPGYCLATLLLFPNRALGE